MTLQERLRSVYSRQDPLLLLEAADRLDALEGELAEARAWLDAVLRAAQGLVVSEFERSNPVVRTVEDLWDQLDALAALTSQRLEQEAQLVKVTAELVAAQAEVARLRKALGQAAGAICSESCWTSRSGEAHHGEECTSAHAALAGGPR